MPTKLSDQVLFRIEETQAALRASIEQARRLADDSERLISQHRAEMEKAEPRNAAS